MRHVPLLDPFKVQGALAPGLRSYFGGVTREPIPEGLASRARELDDRLEPNPESKGRHSEGQSEQVAREERSHGKRRLGKQSRGRSPAKKADRSDRGG
jgi:hypothetical protein